ncbi:glycosyltransferase family 4 protein [Catellatospora citrea]|nr:glycosyltransferase family 4 protein [Catellatospora citrea]RKE12372.1 glycosyltransferase involved in cell wall biosynthesis [Catellatospora citrea]
MGVERRGRGRVVMIVDTGVHGDSRVQKQAISAAEAGWDVTLIGRSPTNEPQEWQLGGAQVRLVVVGGGAGTGGAGGGGGAKAALRRVRTAMPGAVKHARRPVDVALVWYWQRKLGDKSWRRLEPQLWSFEAAFGKVIDELDPDIVHANDFRMLGVGARAVERGRARGRDVKLVWDAHEYLPGVIPYRDHARWLPAHLAYEREYAPVADAVITVSDEIAARLQRDHRLPVTPAVVLNAPEVSHDPGPADAPTLRELCGIGADVPLMVYSGAASPQRGLGLVVEGLPQLPGLHLAMIINQPDGPYATTLRERAAELGVADRIHLMGYVQHDLVVPLLATADLGVMPIRHHLNHEMSLATKFFEYSHARLPIVGSDVRTLAATVRSTGQGEVFRADDVADFVRAAKSVLADPERYRAVYDKPGLLDGWTWQHQADVLERVYSSLLPGR